MTQGQRLKQFSDVVWPMLDDLPSATLEQRTQKLKNDLTAIDALKVSENLEVDPLLDEARRLVDAQQVTRATLETRAGIFVAAIGALIPILLYASEALEPATRSTPPRSILVTVSVLASAYLAGALWWAFQVFKVRRYFVVDTNDLVRVASLGDTGKGLLKELLKSVRQNRDEINSIVDAIKLSQRFLWRSAFCFLLLLAIQLMPEDTLRHNMNSEVRCGLLGEVKSFECELQ